MQVFKATFPICNCSVILHRCDALYIPSSSSSCRATCTDIPDPLSSSLPIIHRFWQVFKATSRILT